METSVAAYNEGERVMKERERGKGQGKRRRRAGCWRQGSVGGYWVEGEEKGWRGGGVGGVSAQKDSGKYDGEQYNRARTFFHPVSHISAVLFQLSEKPPDLRPWSGSRLPEREQRRVEFPPAVTCAATLPSPLRMGEPEALQSRGGLREDGLGENKTRARPSGF